MPISPQNVIYPKNRIKRVSILHDGTLNPPYEFSIAELEFHDGTKAIGIRHNINDWNDNNPDLGYPTCRPGNPTWFILPDINKLLPTLISIFKPACPSKPTY
jgi:hypothetical protein